MPREEQRERWYKSMIARYGSEEAVRAEMVRRQQKSMLNPNRQKGKHHGGFNDRELAARAGRIGGKVSRKNVVE